MSDQPETGDPTGALRERLAAALTDAATEVRQKYHVIPNLGSAPAGVTIQGDVNQLVDAALAAVQPQLAAEQAGRTTPDNSVASSDSTDNPLRQRLAEALAGHAGSKAFLADGREWEHARTAWYTHADVVLAELKPELDRLADYENRITWDTTCGSCARILDSSIRETERADRAVTALAHARSLHQENCPLATGKVGRAAFTCGMCDALAEPEEAAA